MEEEKEKWFKEIILLLTKIDRTNRTSSDSGESASVKIQANGKILLDIYMSPKPSHVILTYEEFIKVLTVNTNLETKKKGKIEWIF